jgi:hypothetical protein
MVSRGYRAGGARHGAGWLRVALGAAAALAVLPAAAKHAERDGIGLLSLPDIASLAGKVLNGTPKPLAAGDANTSSLLGIHLRKPPPVTIDPRRSLLITESAIVSSFPILDVLNRLAAGSPNSMTARQLFDQWMDLHNRAPGIGQGGHCNDELTNGAATLNGFQFDCPRAEGALVGANPTDGGPNAFQPVAVVNRFDLATDPRAGGTDCGEYRLIYAKVSGVTVSTNRMQIIFEGVLPNPSPNGRDLSGCRPVAQFWADLSTVSDPAVRASRLKSFFFTGLPGFQPVVQASHYGFATPNAKGQIRSNLFMQANWALREYRLSLVNNRLKMVGLPNGQSPAGQLFNETDPHAKGADFRDSFLSVVSSLAVNDINTFNANALPSRFDSGDGDQQHATKSHYPAQFAKSPNFSAAIQRKLTLSLSSITPAQVVERSMAMSCAGCHQLSNGKNLGGGLVWPASLQFVHVSEALRETSPEGLSRFRISPALTDVFLPRRKAVLESFLNGR